MSVDSESRQLKAKQVEEIKNLISNSSSMVIVDYKTLTVAEDTELRSKFRQAGATYKVLKNRLVKIALNELGHNEFDSALEGQNAFVFGGDDSIAPARITYEAIGKFKKLKAKCGMIDNEYVDESGVKALSAMPTKEVLYAQLLGMMMAPVSALARALNAIAEKEN